MGSFLTVKTKINASKVFKESMVSQVAFLKRRKQTFLGTVPMCALSVTWAVCVEG